MVFQSLTLASSYSRLRACWSFKTKHQSSGILLIQNSRVKLYLLLFSSMPCIVTFPISLEEKIFFYEFFFVKRSFARYRKKKKQYFCCHAMA